ncbi:hypothetical protein K7432_011859 [Basidiobolus ranarum]|uniref:VOC domain-containing protein n=1 Tax=Basidiobolus ranarum TaxID=34480 RepID=A0ABR2VTZ2_9FUNG
MFDHLSIHVKNLAQSKQFYLQVLKPLGHKLAMEYPQAACFGMNSQFTIAQGTPSNTHIAFTAKSRKEVNSFHEAALKNGGKDNGAPGIRSEYGDNYYAAFVYDLDGNNLEAVYYES